MKRAIRPYFETGSVKTEAIPVPGYYLDWGALNLETGNLRVTDPCYEPGTWCAYTLKNVKPGPYSCGVKVIETDWFNRIAEIYIFHALDIQRTHTLEIIESEHGPWKLVEGADIGVDSGSAGFFEEEFYNALFTGEKCDGHNKDRHKAWQEFYDKCGDITCGDKHVGCLDENHKTNKGYVSSSGFGDGGYPLYVMEKDGQIIAAKIVFINDDEMEDEDEE